MKMKMLLLAIGLTASASATVTIQGVYGDLFDSSGAAVNNNTLYVLVADSSGNFAGGFTLNSSLNDEVAANAAFTTGQVLTLGSSLGSGTIFAIGGTGGGTGDSFAETTISGLTLSGGDLATGVSYAIYWFPGSTYGGGNSGTVGSQVGGFNSAIGESGLSVDPMVLPPDSATVTQGFVTVSQGGSTANATVTAVNLVPEPSAALLGAFGVLGLLRRRRA